MATEVYSASGVNLDEAAKLFGERLRRLRESKGYSLRELADRIPMSHGGLGNYERGVRVPDREAIEAIARALEVPVEELESALFEAQVQALLRANRRLSPRSKEQIIDFIRFAEEQDRKARHAKRQE